MPKLFPKGARTPLMIWPVLLVYTTFSPKGPHVGVPGMTSLGWLKLRHKGRVSRVGRKKHQQVMSLTANIARVEHRVLSKLPLE
jgi:hypothetical protein